MDRLLGACILIGLAGYLALTLCLRNPVRIYGSEMFRNCQRLIVSIQTANWPSIEDRHFIVKYQRGDEASARMVLAEAAKGLPAAGQLLRLLSRPESPHPDLSGPRPFEPDLRLGQ